MNEVYVKATDLEDETLQYLPKQDIFTIRQLVDALNELTYEYKELEEEFEDYKEYVATYKKDRDHWTASEMAEYYANER